MIVDDAVDYEGEDAGFFLKPMIEEPTLESFGWQFLFGQTDMWIYFNTKLGKLTREKTTCGSTDSTDGATTYRKKIEYTELEAYKEQCYKTFDNTIFAKARKTGVNKADLVSNPGQLKELLTALVQEAVLRDFLRIALLADKSFASADYNMIDGWYAKLAADTDVIQSSQVVNATTLNPTNFVATITAIYQSRSRLAKQVPNAEMAWYVTRNVYDAFQSFLLANQNTDASLIKFITGEVPGTLFGIEMKVLDIVDEYLDADFTVSGVIEDAYRIVLAKKDQTAVAVDSSDAGKELEIWYDRDTQLNKFRSTYNLDLQIGYGEYFVVARQNS